MARRKMTLAEALMVIQGAIQDCIENCYSEDTPENEAQRKEIGTAWGLISKYLPTKE